MAKIITDLKNYKWHNKPIPGTENAKPTNWDVFLTPVATKEEVEVLNREIDERRRPSRGAETLGKHKCE